MKTLKKKFFTVLTLFVVAVTTFSFAPTSIGRKAVRKMTPPDRQIQIALLLDTSNSMDGLIDQAKGQLWKIVNDLSGAKCEGIQPGLRIALYEYGNDQLNGREGYIRMVAPMTNDLDEISEKLFSLTTNGGSEYCGHVINTSLNQLQWTGSEKDLQMIFIAGNEPFTQGGVDYREACAKANKKNIVVNTIFCGPYSAGVQSQWKNGADLTEGSYMSIEQDKKTVFIASPFDDRINKLNDELNKTYVAYGAQGRMKKEKQMQQDTNAAAYGSANKVNRAVSKSSHVYKNSSWDLVDAAEDADFEIESVKEDALPKEMKGMNNAEKKKFIEKKQKEREKIKTEIQSLSKKRAAFVLEKKKENKTENMLDDAMIKSIRKQAADKNFKFEQ